MDRIMGLIWEVWWTSPDGQGDMIAGRGETPAAATEDALAWVESEAAEAGLSEDDAIAGLGEPQQAKEMWV